MAKDNDQTKLVKISSESVPVLRPRKMAQSEDDDDDDDSHELLPGL